MAHLVGNEDWNGILHPLHPCVTPLCPSYFAGHTNLGKTPSYFLLSALRNLRTAPLSAEI